MISQQKATLLREAWHGTLTAAEVAKKHRMASEQTVFNFWSSEKRAGRLPQHSRVKNVAPVVCDEEGDTIFCIGDVDPYLAALKAVHGGERVRGINDEMPLQLLMIEKGDKEGRYTPSVSRLRDFRRGRDAYVAGKMATPPAPSKATYASLVTNGARRWWLLVKQARAAGPFAVFSDAVRHARKHNLVKE
jgi:hypothetical protein